MKTQPPQLPLLLAGTAFFISGSFCFGLPCSAETGWQVTQTGDACPMGPGTTVIVASNGLRVTGPMGRMVMVTSAPNWRVYLFNSQARTVYQTTLNDWIKTATQQQGHRSLEDATWKRGSTSQIAGMRAYGFVMDKPPTSARSSNTHSGPVSAAHLWVAQDIATSPAISNLFSRLYGMPDCQRLPLRLATVIGGQASMQLDTVNVGQLAVSSSLFQPPAGYKTVASYVDVITGASDSDELKKMLNDR